ncbi:MAG: HAD family hydrolase [Candidatus Odinarchaeota archaeon]
MKKKKKKIALVTNSPNYIIQILEQNFNISNYFDEILSIDYEEAPLMAKPSSNGIEFVLRELCAFEFEICKFKAIMIGDSEIDIIAAKKAGIFSCLLINKNNRKIDYQKWKEKPNYIINNFYGLLDI